MTRRDSGITRHNITRRVKAAARDDRVIFTHHARERLRQRGITEQQAKEVLREGVQQRTEPPDEEGQNPKTRMYKRVAGDDIEVVASVTEIDEGEAAVVITTIR